ncbi:hypothetical protein PIIN_08592 [Serendipita indica DSM 11827]|uniref:Uncharacterized protein n=1 Tax=Serendipita indica (strain DSM 11827) TaxID=1109443 RepID=G4TTJ7_SERID|nr:hypothetical protein PIIN_08592 [Serendipita indica DSM 11827]
MSQTSFYRQFINCIYRDDQGIELDSVSLSRKLGFEEALAKARVTLSIPETSAIVLYTRTYLPADDTKGRLVRVCEDVWQWAVTEPSVCEMYMRIDAGSLNARPISTLSTTYTGLPSSRGSSSDVRGQSTRTNVSRSSATKRIGYQQRAAITKKVSQSLQVAELKSYGWVGDKPLHTSRRPGPPKNYSYTRKLRKREERKEAMFEITTKCFNSFLLGIPVHNAERTTAIVR